MSEQPPTVFISYSHNEDDVVYKDRLLVHLQGLVQRSVIANWHDKLLTAGQLWDEEIIRNLETSRVILLLISPDFIASNYIGEVELKRASVRYARGEILVIPVLISEVYGWQEKAFGEHKLGDFQVPTGNLQFIDSLPKQHQNAAFAKAVEGIERAVKNLMMPASVADVMPSLIPRRPVYGFVARHDAEGRDIVARLKGELAPGKNVLVALSGPGGVGKTTLAAEAARELAGEYEGRVVWSSASGRANFELSTLLDDIAAQLGRADLRTLAPVEKEAAVRALVAESPALVVLDNYETIASDVQQRIEGWLAAAPCCALITSRPRVAQALNITISEMSRAEAGEFLEKLVKQTQDPQIFSDEIRARVYETAEARPFVMQWIVGQIDEDAREPQAVLRELAEGRGSVVERVFDRSFNLPSLGDDGRDALLALSLFVPGASRAALAAVAGLGDDAARGDGAIKRLRALWLIKGLDENRRFTVEGLTRTRAGVRLSEDPRAGEFHRRFVSYFLNYAEAHAQKTAEDFDALEAEKDNLLSAMDAAFEIEDWESTILTHIALREFLDVHGYWDEAILHGEQALKAARIYDNAWYIGALSNELGNMFAKRGDYDSAKNHYELAVEIARQIDAKLGLAATLHQLAILAQSQGEMEEARRLYDESLEIKKKLGNQSGVASTLHQLGGLAQDQGEVEEARRLYDESLEINKKLGDQSRVAGTLHQLGRLAQDQGKVEEARRLYDESLEINKKLGDQSGIAITLHALANLARDGGDLTEALLLYSQSLEITERLGDKGNLALIFYNLGLLIEQEGNKAEAMRLFRESLSIFEKLKSPYAEMVQRDLERVEGKSS